MWEPSANPSAGKGYTASLLGAVAHTVGEGCSGYHPMQQLLCNLQMGTDAPHVSLCREWAAEDKLTWL